VCERSESSNPNGRPNLTQRCKRFATVSTFTQVAVVLLWNLIEKGLGSEVLQKVSSPQVLNRDDGNATNTIGVWTQKNCKKKCLVNVRKKYFQQDIVCIFYSYRFPQCFTSSKKVRAMRNQVDVLTQSSVSTD